MLAARLRPSPAKDSYGDGDQSAENARNAEARGGVRTDQIRLVKAERAEARERSNDCER
jgi:hypothetical protein